MELHNGLIIFSEDEQLNDGVPEAMRVDDAACYAASIDARGRNREFDGAVVRLGGEEIPGFIIESRALELRALAREIFAAIAS